MHMGLNQNHLSVHLECYLLTLIKYSSYNLYGGWGENDGLSDGLRRTNKEKK